ncbi:MAG: DNA repair protein RecO C-terminal domain-containing protein [Prevotellaceae bacterium]|jgi:DNA repair protein RecO (recombination protein O)|nr:DNA repair protein RecO C-terminal domain-containing protein [Prevotellaceae bacterium]
MTHSVRLIVLLTIKYSDTSLLVYAYTNLFGRQTYILRGIRTAKKHSAAAHFFPLHILEAQVYHKTGASIHHIKEFHTDNPLLGIRTHLHKSAIALFLGEVLYKTIKEEEPNETLFHFLTGAIFELDLLTQVVANFHLYFLAQLNIHLGFAPLINFHPQHAPVFDIQKGHFDSIGKSTGPIFSVETSALFYRLCTASNASEAASIAMNGVQRRLIIDAIVQYLSFHLNTPLVFKSPEVLQQVLQ